MEISDAVVTAAAGVEEADVAVADAEFALGLFAVRCCFAGRCDDEFAPLSSPSLPSSSSSSLGSNALPKEEGDELIIIAEEEEEGEKRG